jgi:hypothetical protein
MMAQRFNHKTYKFIKRACMGSMSIRDTLFAASLDRSVRAASASGAPAGGGVAIGAETQDGWRGQQR